MTTKLTLAIEEKVIDSAKKYARKEGKSLSGIVEAYLKSLSTDPKNPSQFSERVTNLLGVVTLPDDFDYKQELDKALTKKYK